MTFFAWLWRRKAQDTNAPSPWYTMIRDDRYDLLPAAIEVHALAGDLPFDAETLAAFAMEYGNGKYIRKADIPDGITREHLQNAIMRTTQWAVWPRRHAQLTDPDIAIMHSHVELRICLRCQEVSGPERRDFAFGEIERVPSALLPLDRPCCCAYHPVRKPRPDR